MTIALQIGNRRRLAFHGYLFFSDINDHEPSDSVELDPLRGVDTGGMTAAVYTPHDVLKRWSPRSSIWTGVLAVESTPFNVE